MATIDSREDIEDIKQLKIKYCSLLDARRVDDLVELFTDDATCQFEAVFGSVEEGRWEGKEAIRRGYQTKWGDAGAPWTSIHAVTNAVVQVDGDTASGRHYLLDYLMGVPDRSPLTLLGIYDEEYHREDGSWKISRCRIDVLYRLAE